MVAAAAQAIAARFAGGAADIRSGDCSAVRDFTGELRCVVDTVAADGLTCSDESSSGGLEAALCRDAVAAHGLTCSDESSSGGLEAALCRNTVRLQCSQGFHWGAAW